MVYYTKMDFLWPRNGDISQERIYRFTSSASVNHVMTNLQKVFLSRWKTRKKKRRWTDPYSYSAAYHRSWGWPGGATCLKEKRREDEMQTHFVSVPRMIRQTNCPGAWYDLCWTYVCLELAVWCLFHTGHWLRWWRDTMEAACWLTAVREHRWVSGSRDGVSIQLTWSVSLIFTGTISAVCQDFCYPWEMQSGAIHWQS